MPVPGIATRHVVDRPGLDPAYRPLGEHCFGQGHGQPGLDLDEIAGGSQGVVHARVWLASGYLSTQCHERSGMAEATVASRA